MNPLLRDLLDRRPRTQSLARTFLTGLAALLPLVITIGVVLWLLTLTESMFGGVLKLVLPNGAYRVGMGITVGLLLILAAGVLTEAFFFRKFIDWFEELLNRIPLVKTVYGAVRDLTRFLSKDGSPKFSRVVMVQLPNVPARLIGFVTLETFEGMALTPLADEVAVYLPMSYQIGGFMLFVPRHCLTPVDMSLEEGMRLVITAGLSRPEESMGPLFSASTSTPK